jgi:hypothetical protein
MRRGSLRFGRAAVGAVAITMGMTGVARAANVDVVNDTWIDADRTAPASPVSSEYGVDSDNDGNIESAWYSANPTGTTTTSGHLTKAVPSGSVSWTTYFTPESTPITLANAGDNLKVTWVFTPTVAAQQTNTNQNFRLALVDTPGVQRISTDTNPTNPGGYTGYAMFMNMSIGPTANLGNSSPFRLMRRGVASGDILATGANWTALSTTGATAGNHGYDSGTQYTFTMDLTRNASNGLDIVVRMAGGTLDNDGLAQVVFTDTTPGTTGGFTFDSFVIRPSGNLTTADTFDTTLFRVETNVPIPEPTAAAVLLGGACATGLLRRRRGA